MKRKRKAKKLLNVILLLIFVLVILIFVEVKFWELLEKKEIKMISLEDRCSIMFENVLHAIKDSSGCENYCRAECITREMDFYKSEFEKIENSCNNCNCYCK